MKFYVTGASGMLGRAVCDELEQQHRTVVRLSHRACPINDRLLVAYALTESEPGDVLINCAGVLPGKGDGIAMTLTNALGPQVLSAQAVKSQIKLIHVSTDCVFSGQQDEAYTVDAIPDPIDLYGRSKLVGEQILIPEQPDLVTVVRTSFIGLDHGLLSWILATPGTLDGWVNAIWTGSTVWAVAKALVLIALNPPGGIQHLATSSPIAKVFVITLINELLDLGRRVRAKSNPRINRALVPTIVLPPLAEALPEIKERVPSHL